MNNIVREARNKKQAKKIVDIKTKTILGIDPGSTRIGYGLISFNDRNKTFFNNEHEHISVLGYGYIDIKDLKSKGERLIQLQKDLNELLDKYKPDCIAIESLYFFKNAKTFTPVVESKGVILLTLASAGISVFEYTPLQIKQTITGYGKANKSLIEKLLRTSLSINSHIKPDDASDALAVAICHLRHLTCF